jgi:SnoaL-like domain
MSARNVEIILGGLVDAVRLRDPECIAGFLAPDLVWDGVEPGLRCEGREQAMGLIRRRLAKAPLRVDAVEAIDAGDNVIVGLRGPGFNQTPGDLATVGQIYFVFTFSGEKVVHWRDCRTRADAIAAAGADIPHWR